MARYRGKSQFLNIGVFICLEVVSLCLLASDSAARQMWLGRWFTSTQAFIWGKLDDVRSYTRLKEENARLSQENAKLLADALGRNVPSGGSESLWRNIRGQYSILPARIVNITFKSQHNYLIVDRGSEDGVRQNDGIITTNGVAGVVTGVSRRFCYGISYANKDMTLSVRHGKSGLVGSMNWDGIHSNVSILSGIPIHIEANPGDTVYTSGYSSIFPPDIPIGTIGEKYGSNGSTSDYSVVLSEDFRKVSYVMIVRNLDRDEINGLKDDQN